MIPGRVGVARGRVLKMAAEHLLLIRNASQIVTVCSNKEERLAGDAMKNISVLDSIEEGLSVAVGKDGNIAALGTDSHVGAELPGATFKKVIDAEGMSVVPGLVDAHTHPVWLGDRVHEFAMKVRSRVVMAVVEKGRHVQKLVLVSRCYIHGHPCPRRWDHVHSGLCAEGHTH